MVYWSLIPCGRLLLNFAGGVRAESELVRGLLPDGRRSNARKVCQPSLATSERRPRVAELSPACVGAAPNTCTNVRLASPVVNRGGVCTRLRGTPTRICFCQYWTSFASWGPKSCGDLASIDLAGSTRLRSSLSTARKQQPQCANNQSWSKGWGNCWHYRRYDSCCKLRLCTRERFSPPPRSISAPCGQPPRPAPWARARGSEERSSFPGGRAGLRGQAAAKNKTEGGRRRAACCPCLRCPCC